MRCLHCLGPLLASGLIAVVKLLVFEYEGPRVPHRLQHIRRKKKKPNLLGSGFAVAKGEELRTALFSPVRDCAGIVAVNYLCCASEMSGPEKGREVGVR